MRLAQEVSDEAGLIVEGAFTSTQDLVNSTRWGWLPIERLITQHFDAGSRIAQIGSPLLVVHGSLDTMVTPALGRDYADVAPVRGVVVGPSSSQSLSVSVDVARI